jgi:predicted O-methyltransferase YrrM
MSIMAADETWNAVDRYFADLLIGPDAALDAALKSSAAAGLPAIQVSPTQGKFLHLIAVATGAKNILEIGTLGGYSTIWLARALPKDGTGKLITLEYEPKHAEVARANLARAGLAGVVDVRVGRAIDTLPKLHAENAGPFDLVFLDADKTGYPDYLEWAVKLSRPGAVIIADNVVRKGAVADPNNTDPNVRAVRRFNELVAAHPRLTATALQTVGSKGYDGFVMAVVTDAARG